VKKQFNTMSIVI